MSAPVRFLGWRMVAVAFFVDFVAVGFFFYSYGVFFKAIAADFGGTRLGVSIGLTITTAVGALVSPILGIALDRYPLKRIMGLGSFLMALGFAGLSQVENELQFYLVLAAFIGVGAGAMGGLSTAKLVANWFTVKRGRALGIAATGISFSGVVMPFVSAALIESLGWRSGFLVYAVFTAVIVLPFVLLAVISSPEDTGSHPDGLPAPVGGNSDGTSVTHSPPATPILHERNFWALVTVIGLLFCCQSATLTHMVPRVTDSGVTLQAASLVMSVCAGLGMLGKLTFGWLGDSWSARRSLWLIIACQILGQLAMFQVDTLWLFTVGAGLFGFGMGGTVPLQGALIGRIFGRKRFGKALGAMRPAMFPLQIAGVPFAGWMFDTTGSYDTAFKILLILYVLAATSALAFRHLKPASD